MILKVHVTLTSLAIALAVVSTASAQPARTGATTQATSAASESEAPSAELSADEKAILANIDAFAEAYNKGDAQAIAALFSEDGQIITQEGESVEGREAIEQGFSAVFEDTPQTQIEVFIDSLKFIGSDLALELGQTIETPAPGETPTYGRYTVLHVRRDGKWMMAAARDTEADPPTAHDRLLPLAWLEGEWVDADGSVVVHTTCRWSDDGNYLLQEMRIERSGEEAMQVSQRIGWDPLARRIRSWSFDTEGGFSEGVWTRTGDSWVIKTTGVGADGSPGSATSAIVPAGRDGYVWRMHDHVIGDEILPSVEVKVVRKPPTPGTASRN